MPYSTILQRRRPYRPPFRSLNSLLNKANKERLRLLLLRCTQLAHHFFQSIDYSRQEIKVYFVRRVLRGVVLPVPQGRDQWASGRDELGIRAIHLGRPDPVAPGRPNGDAALPHVDQPAIPGPAHALTVPDWLAGWAQVIEIQIRAAGSILPYQQTWQRRIFFGNNRLDIELEQVRSSRPLFRANAEPPPIKLRSSRVVIKKSGESGP
jgi:hypothetical protein